MADKSMILRLVINEAHTSAEVCQKINEAIPDAGRIVSVVHELDRLGQRTIYVYYRLFA